MSERLGLQQPVDQTRKYSKFRIKGWISFDPVGKTLREISEAIEKGDGFFTVVEVERVEDDLARVDDDEARECFENLLGDRNVVQNPNDIPENPVEQLRSVLRYGGKTSLQKDFPSAASKDDPLK